MNNRLTETKSEELELLEQFGEDDNQGDKENLIELSNKSFKYELLMMKIKNWVGFNAEKYELDETKDAKVDNIFKALCLKVKSNSANQVCGS